MVLGIDFWPETSLVEVLPDTGGTVDHRVLQRGESGLYVLPSLDIIIPEAIESGVDSAVSEFWFRPLIDVREQAIDRFVAALSTIPEAEEVVVSRTRHGVDFYVWTDRISSDHHMGVYDRALEVIDVFPQLSLRFRLSERCGRPRDELVTLSPDDQVIPIHGIANAQSEKAS